MLGWLFAAVTGCTRPVPPPPVILLTVDTLRYDHLNQQHTPNILSILDDSVHFTQAFSPISVTGPAFVTLMTGLDVSSHGVHQNLFRRGRTLKRGTPTLASILRKKQYSTAAFLSGFTLQPRLGLNAGFQTYDFRWQKRRWGDRTAELAVNWLREQSSSFFMWYHTYDAHGPWERWGGPCSTSAIDAEQQRRIPLYQRLGECTESKEYARRYGEAVKFADKNVGLILNELKTLGKYQDSWIVITADHGESFTERELWFDHGTTPYIEQLQVPLLIKAPSSMNWSGEDERLVSLSDVLPTILDGLELESPAVDGFSLRNSRSVREHLVGESSHCKSADVLTCAPTGPKGKWFSIRSKTETLINAGDQWRYYDRSSDPLELRPQLVGSNPILKQHLQKTLATRMRQITTIPSHNSQLQPSAESELLKQLGYVDHEEH